MSNQRVSEIVFFNNLHNGDIHFSRQFIKYIENKINIPCFTTHMRCPLLLSDTKIPYRKVYPMPDRNISLFLDKETLFFNTWIGQNGMKWHSMYGGFGCTLKHNYQMYTDLCKQINISLLPELNYIPTIDYSYYDIKNIVHIKTFFYS
jgi:hypothetical protein